MGWDKKSVMSSFSTLKSKSRQCVWIAGVAFLLLVLPYVAIVNHSNNRKIDAIQDELETLKTKLSSRDLESVSNRGASVIHADIGEGLNIKQRKKRDVKQKEQEPGLHSLTQIQGGAVYIRWGRTTCPGNETELVYAGIAGGSWHGNTGSATNFQCLPNKPVWGRYTSKDAGAYMYGVEYKEAFDDLLDMSNVQSNLNNHNMPCVVCRSSIRKSSLMIPAVNICVKGWHLEYNGYLLAGHYTSKAGTNYICVDDSPETDQAGYRSENGALLYRVKAICGSLPCPRYENSRELTCAVCTK